MAKPKGSVFLSPHSPIPIRQRERKQQKFKSRASAQKFLATHAAVYKVFNIQPSPAQPSLIRSAGRPSATSALRLS